jgi:hypothetical protein
LAQAELPFPASCLKEKVFNLQNVKYTLQFAAAPCVHTGKMCEFLYHKEARVSQNGEHMKELLVILGILSVLICIAPAGAATVVATNAQDAAALVYVSGYDIAPGVFYPYETGTVTVHVTNAANASVSVSQPALIDPHVRVVNQGDFVSATNIGPGVTTDYTFIITATPPDGTYLPLFTVSTNAYGGNAIHSQIKLKVDSTDVRASISKKPDTFSIEKTDTVNVSVVNPRLGDVSDVLVVASSPGSDISPEEKYVGDLPAGGSVEVPFSITPHQQSDVTFNVSFRNGDNLHTVGVVLPLNIGEDKSAAVPVINNVVLVSSGESYTMTGDVTNAVVTDATGMILSVGAPAHAVEPYSSYAVGALASNDFSSFTLTFTAGDLSVVPVTIQWKDADGNTFTTTKTLDLRTLSGSGGTGSRSGSSGGSSSGSSATGSSTARAGAGGPGGGGLFSFGGSRSGGLSAFYPLIAGAVILIIAIVAWMKRKWIVAKFRKQ